MSHPTRMSALRFSASVGFWQGLRLSVIAVMALLSTHLSVRAEEPTTTSVDRTVTEHITTIHERKVTEIRTESPSIRKAAIFVKNRAEGVDDAKVMVLEDLVVSRLTDSGFSIISREDVLNSVKDFADAGANRGDNTLPGADLDQILSNNTSALRLAQNLGADYVLLASITTFGENTREYDGNGVHTLISEAKMRVSYKLLDATAGGSLTGDVVESVAKERVQKGARVDSDIVNDLLDESAKKLAAVLGQKAEQGRIRTAKNDARLVEFDLACGMADLAVPEIVQNDQGEYQITANKYRVEAMAVTVALDGIVVGTTPGPFQVAPGLHKIRVTREGFKDWEQTINIKEGMRLNVALQLSDAGWVRWRNNAQFLNDLKAETKMTDAQVEAWKGFAKFLEQSGYKVDYKVDDHRDIRSNSGGSDTGPRDERPRNIETPQPPRVVDPEERDGNGPGRPDAPRPR